MYCKRLIDKEKQPKYKALFKDDLDVKRIVPQVSAMYGTSIKPGKTLLFLDEIQECLQAVQFVSVLWGALKKAEKYCII